MSKRSRIRSYGGAALVIVAGALLGALAGGATGPIVALVLMGLGLVAITALIFFEVGLSEDRQRAREKKQAQARRDARRRPGPGADRPRLERSRGHPRRLR